MDNSLSPVEGDIFRLTPQQILEEFISQRVDRWKARQVRVLDRELAARIIAMSWDYDSLPSKGPGCLVRDREGEYVYVPYDERREGLSTDLLNRIETLDHWFINPASGATLRQMDKMLEKEVNDTCFWEFLDGGDASRVDFHGKIKILAKYRLMQNGVDISPTNPLNPQFQFAITNITEFGNVNMTWHYLNWDCSEREVVRCLDAVSRPRFVAETVLDRHLRQLEAIHHPEEAAKEAQDLAKELQSEKPVQNEPEWSYFLCGTHEASVPLKDRFWISLRKRPNDFKVMKRMSREQGKWAIVIRSWQLRHYTVCSQIHSLQRRQLTYCQAVDEAAVLESGENAAEAYFGNEGWVSLVDFARHYGPALFAGRDLLGAQPCPASS